MRSTCQHKRLNVLGASACVSVVVPVQKIFDYYNSKTLVKWHHLATVKKKRLPVSAEVSHSCTRFINLFPSIISDCVVITITARDGCKSASRWSGICVVVALFVAGFSLRLSSSHWLLRKLPTLYCLQMRSRNDRNMFIPCD